VDGYFFDSSGIVKRYVLEIGSAWVCGLVDPAAGNEVFLVRITGVEVVSALGRHLPPLQPTLLAQALADFQHDFQNQYQLREVTPALVREAMRLAEVHRLRGYDAVQLAAAIETQGEFAARGLSMTFGSADSQLNSAAAIEGVTVDNPNSH
jgi:predicted nucleic acid-binding protein